MKKTILIIVATLLLGVVASAQPRAIGIRNGQVSYEHNLGDPNFIELNLGIDYGFTSGAASYNWIFSEPDWTSKGEWAFYGGPGVTMGTTTKIDEHGEKKHPLVFGGMFQVGLEYTFWFPLQLSVDVRPTFGIRDGEFWADGLVYGIIPHFGVRYRF